jgi:hypothetical protein
MSSKLLLLALISNCLTSFVTVAQAGALAVTVRNQPPPSAAGFHLGTSARPDGATLTVDSSSLLFDGQPCIPVMGEFHYSRYPADEWREELLKMKAGGLTVVATYVFWIHHEEIEDQWDWTGRRNLREFVRLAGEVGLKVVVRCGPWCHGEVRNGGLPDWLLALGLPVRTTDERFLARVRLLYGQIARQLQGELWKDGGPVIGIQLDNEFSGPAEYLLALKKIARASGLDLPLYTRTGWPALTTPMPFGEIVPLYGSYAEGFWDRDLTSMPGRYWAAFRFSTLRVDDNIANEQLGRRGAVDAPDVARYPYLTCEIGGGMMNSYHRRILIEPADIESTTLVKLGSGSTLPGYYMYHGGTNPEGKRSTLMEEQNTSMTNYNDLPVKNYDFQAPLGEFGQIRPQYHLLRRLHLFLADFGPVLARMPATMPEIRPAGENDAGTLRWAVRSDGAAGFVFVNNFERGRPMPAKPAVQFALSLPAGALTFPATPIDVPADSRFIWPFNLDLGHGLTLSYATAQLVCDLSEGHVRTLFFAEIPGVPSRFAVAGEAAVREPSPGRGVAFQLAGRDGGTVQVVLLDEADSLALWKGSWQGSERVFLTTAGMVIDGTRVRLASERPADLSVGVYPAPAGIPGGAADGLFTRFTPPAPPTVRPEVTLVEVQKAGPLRVISRGKISEPVATEPGDADFAQAAVWRIKLPANLDPGIDPILRLHYRGDVARVLLNGRLLNDDFYNGRPFDIGLRRYAPEILHGELQVAILPLQKDAVVGARKRIFVAASARPDFGGAAAVATIDRVEIVPRYEVQLAAGGPH